MRLMKDGRGFLAAALALSLAGPALAEITGHMQARYMINDIDKISRDTPVGDNSINKKKVDTFGFFKNEDWPGWYGGFYAAREHNYSLVSETVGPMVFRNSKAESENTIKEVYVGKTYFGDFGEVSGEVMVGGESNRDGLKYRPKVSGRYEFANGVSIFGYGMVLFQNYDGPRQSVAIDREYLETELQPGVGYKIDDHMGVWANFRMRDRTQKRALYGDLKEQERFVELGLWKNFGEVYTNVRLRTGKFEMSDPVSIIRNDKVHRVVGEMSIPLADKVRGIVNAGYMWENYGVHRDGAATHLRAPLMFLGLRYEL